MIYVQHLLGIGHLKRMTLLADALASAGADVLLASGGMPVSHIAASKEVRFLQLPPVRAADESFSSLVDGAGKPVTDQLKEERTDMLLGALGEFRPDTLVVELFPLGRRQMRFELIPLLDAARPVCATIACSVRDIVNRRPRRETEAIDWLNLWFDLLLVHGDERFTPISDSVPGISGFTGRVVHTGYLTEASSESAVPRKEVLVSAGGGAAGEKLFLAAAEAAGLRAGQERWRIRHGVDAGASLLERMRILAADDTIIEPVASDFRNRLSAAALTISQFGYNTAMDILQAGAPAIVVPFEGGNETEQIRRAEALAGVGLTIIREDQLSGPRLASAAGHSLTDIRREGSPVDLKGLGRSVDLILDR